MKHTDELTLQRLADSELTPERVRAARTHLIDCARCQSNHESFKAETELLRSALRGSDEPLPLAMRSRADLSWILAAAIVLAVLVVSTLWSGVSPGETGEVNDASLLTRLLIRGVLFEGWSAMVALLLQVVSLAVSGLAAAVTLRWAWRRFHSSAAALSVVLVGLAADDATAAVVERHDGEYVLRADERIDNDLMVVASRVRIDGIVTGDLIVLAERVEIAGKVEGDLLGLAETIVVIGEVAGNLRTGSHRLEIEGEIGRNVLSASASTRLLEGARVRGSFTGASSGRIVFEAPIERDVTAVAHSQTLNTRVGGSVSLAGKELHIGPRTIVAGETRFRGRDEPEIDTAAELSSPVRFEPARDWSFDLRLPPLAVFVCFWAAAFLFGAPLLFIGPDVAEAITAVHLPAHGKSLLVGFVSLVASLSLALVAMISLIGAPLSLLLLGLTSFALYAAQAYVGAYIGRELLGRPETTGETLGRLALGLFVIHVVGMIPVVGSIATSVAALMGFGALTSWALDHMPPWSRATAVTVQSTGS